MNLLIAVFLSLVLIGPVLEGPCPAGESTKITDLAGRQVYVPRKPERIVCLGSGTLRLIVYLQGQDKVVGVEDYEKRFPTRRPYWIAHPELGRLPSIGPGGPGAVNKEPDLEKVLAVKPDVIFITYLDRGKAEALQKKISIPVVVLTYGPFGTFDENVYDSMRLCGKILDKQKRAESVISYIENSRKDLLKRVKGVPESRKPSVYIGGVGYRGMQGLESTEAAYVPFEWIKARHVAQKHSRKGHLFVGREEILGWDPDIIFIDSGGSELIRQDYARRPAFYRGLKAFRNKRVYVLHAFNWYMTNLETVIVDAYAAGKILYPEEFKNVDLHKKADEVYLFLTGRPLHKEMEKLYGKIGENPLYLQREY